MLDLARTCVAISLTIAVAAPAWADAVNDLVKAAQLDNPTMIKSLLAAGGNPNTIDPISGEPVLILALREDAHRAIEVLLKRNDLLLEQTAPNGNTALMMAAFKHNKAAVDALLAKGANVNRQGWSALHFAAASGDDDIAKALLARGAAIDALAPNNQTALMVAAREGQETVALVLLRAGANAKLKSGEGLTASQIATRADKARVAAAIDGYVSR